MLYLIHAPDGEIYLQPIWDLKLNEILGHEAFFRSVGPSIWDQVNENSAVKIDSFVHQMILNTIPDNNLLLFLNLHPYSLSKIFDIYEYNKNIVLEITEVERLSLLELEKFSLEAKRRGIKIALDDFGAGYNNVTILDIVRPAFVKLDKSIVQDNDTAVVQKYIQLIVDWASDNNSSIIAEGIESKKHLDNVLRNNIRYGQGFLLGVPFNSKKLYTASETAL